MNYAIGFSLFAAVAYLIAAAAIVSAALVI